MTKIIANLTRTQLLDAAVEQREGVRNADGVFVATTGLRTGRSPKDKFIVCDQNTETSVDWGAVNQPMSPKTFKSLAAKVEEYQSKLSQVYYGEYCVGAHAEHTIKVKVTTEYAWHQVFASNMFIENMTQSSENNDAWEIISMPRCHLDPNVDGVNSAAAAVINFTSKQVLLIGLRYAGELKKSMFTVLNYILPAHNVLPMHCAASTSNEDNVCLFFGLSGTGKTTLSADPEHAKLIGDDEHGWSDHGVFNFEGGCYAKCIDLSAEQEPLIWQAIKPGAILENVFLDEQLRPDYSDARYTSNSRASYPLEFIENRVKSSQGAHPSAVIF